MRRIISSLLFLLPLAITRAAWTPPEVRLPADRKHPVIACTQQELQRLRNALAAGAGEEHAVVNSILRRADAAMKQTVRFPPRGGQHNQWYQCDTCQTALKTLADTQHQCPICEKIYSGYPYDDVVFARTHHRLLAAMHDTAWAYALTDQAEYAQFAKNILLGYAERYTKYPLHGNTMHNIVWTWLAGGHLFEQTLSEASSMATRIAPAYDLIHDSPVLAEADHERIRTGLMIPMLQTIDRYKAGVNNWQSWHNAAMITAGAVLGDVSWVEKAIRGEDSTSLGLQALSMLGNLEAKSLPMVGHSFAFQMEYSLTSDGMWYENSWAYHFYALSALVITAESARRLDIDLWSCPGLKKMFLLPMQYAMPDGSLPRFGDDVQSSVRGRHSLFEPAYAAYGEPSLLVALPAKPTWNSVLHGRDASLTVELPDLTSQLFVGAGHAILRTGGRAGQASVLTFGPYGGFHGHLDKLSFVYFAFGREMGVDPGRARSQAYRLPIHGNWYKATISHNTVVVDGGSQHGVAGGLDFFAAGDVFAAVGAHCSTAYAGVLHHRVLVQAPEYLLVIDDLTADRDRQFDWVYHNRGIEAVGEAAAQPADSAGDMTGAEYIQEVKTGQTAEAIRVAFRGEEITNHLLLAGQDNTWVTTGTGVGATVTERVPMALVRRHGRQARFVAVFEPLPASETPSVTGLETAVDGAVIGVTIHRGQDTDTVRLVPGTELTVSRNNQVHLSKTLAAGQ